METKKKTHSQGSDINIKILILFGILLAMQIPVFMIRGMIEDRKDNRQTVYHELANENWGGDVLVESPYMFSKELNYKEDDDTISVVSIPQEINITTNVNTQELKRGIFQIPVFSADIDMDIEFNAPLKKQKSENNDLYLFIPINQLKQQGAVSAILNGAELPVNIKNYTSLGQGLEFSVDAAIIKNDEPLEFKVNLTALGSNEISFAPLAHMTTIKTVSSWSSPSFFGNILPLTRTVTSEGFEAEWEDVVIGASLDSTPKEFGVKFINPVDHYRLTERSTKYALLFIALTFLSFFIAEIRSKCRIHPVQYLLAGVGMVLFYSLLLSFSEQVGFSTAYIISSIATIMLISGYTFTIMKNRSTSVLIASLLVTLYVFLYLILLMEEYSLMAGSILLFIVLGVTMFTLRNVKWYDKVEEDETI